MFLLKQGVARLQIAGADMVESFPTGLTGPFLLLLEAVDIDFRSCGRVLTWRLRVSIPVSALYDELYAFERSFNTARDFLSFCCTRNTIRVRIFQHMQTHSI
jgi:hypothetical protein